MIGGILADLVGDIVALSISHSEHGISHYAIPVADWEEVRKHFHTCAGLVLPSIVNGKLQMPSVKLDPNLN